ncbi:MAG: EamA family transporter [Acidobacteriaceae bacterium]
MAFAIHFNALIALSSAAFWGGGDFSGGMGVKACGNRTSRAIGFVLLAHAISLTALVAIALCSRGVFVEKSQSAWIGSAWHRQVEDVSGDALRMGPGQRTRIGSVPRYGSRGVFWGESAAEWAILAGVTGALGLVAFYIALSRGGMGISAALSGLLAAGIPAVASSLMEGVPSALRLAGFGVAAGAIWLIAAGDSTESKDGSGSTMALAMFAGVMFGVYFIALKMANPLGLIVSMAVARLTSVTLCSLVLAGMAFFGRGRVSLRRAGQAAPRQRRQWPAVWGWACAVAVLDTGGNLLFMAAARGERLDVVSVLASLYPVGTILLAAWVLQERPARRQVVGMLAALAAVVMITLQG